MRPGMYLRFITSTQFISGRFRVQGEAGHSKLPLDTISHWSDLITFPTVDPLTVILKIRISRLSSIANPFFLPAFHSSPS